MYVYIASSFRLTPEVEELSTFLESQGFSVTVKWWRDTSLHDKVDTVTDDEFYSDKKTESIYYRDKDGIWIADALVFLVDGGKRHNGPNVEVGMADAFGIPIFSLGPLERNALYYKVYRCKSRDELVAELQKIRKAKEEKA